MKNLSILIAKAILVAIVLNGCTNEIEITASDDLHENSRNCIFTVPDFQWSEYGNSRSTITIEGNELKFAWAGGDRIGIVPNEGAQVYFDIDPNDAGGNTAVFDGGAWALKANSTYAAYYPFVADYTMKQTAIPVTFTGQVQGGANTDHLGDFDYMAAKPKMANSVGGVNFDFNHLAAMALVRFAVPKANTTLSKMTIASDEEWFVEKDEYSLLAESIALPTEKAVKSQSMSVDLVNLTTSEDSEIVTVYFMTAPAQLSGKDLTVTVMDNDDNVVRTFIVHGKDMVAGNGYLLEAANTDLSPVVQGQENMYKTANCYIVTEAGDYKFRATHKGNSNMEADKLTISYAKVLWETFGTRTKPAEGDLVNSVTYDRAGYINFVATEMKGSAIIAAYHDNSTPEDLTDDEIVWSWHIWLTDQPLEEIYKDNTPEDNTDNPIMMDRNLGATSTTATGFLYQWGRKDPFPSGLNDTYIYETTRPDYGNDIIKSTPEMGTIEVSIKNPMKYIEFNSSNSDWQYVQDNTRWSSIKTNYDPSPYGWRVPDGGPNGVWCNAGLSDADGMIYASSVNAYQGILQGMDFPILLDETTTFYPAAGNFSSTVYDVSYWGGYWSVTVEESSAYMLHFNFNEMMYLDPSFSTLRAETCAIRCMKDKNAAQ